VNLALPSLLYTFALRHIPASNGAVLNSTAPMSGALLAALFLPSGDVMDDMAILIMAGSYRPTRRSREPFTCSR
jgi:hypothetical protein